MSTTKSFLILKTTYEQATQTFATITHTHTQTQNMRLGLQKPVKRRTAPSLSFSLRMQKQVLLQGSGTNYSKSHPGVHSGWLENHELHLYS